jgi:hypothetical protein
MKNTSTKSHAFKPPYPTSFLVIRWHTIRLYGIDSGRDHDSTGEISTISDLGLKQYPQPGVIESWRNRKQSAPCQRLETYADCHFDARRHSPIYYVASVTIEEHPITYRVFDRC